MSLPEPQPEPWLRGPLAGVHPLVMPVFFSFTLVREDLAIYLGSLTSHEVWTRHARSSIGFHGKHLAGSVDRITTYLIGEELSSEQFDWLRHEHDGTEDGAALLALVDKALAASEERLLSIAPDSLYDGRTVGRQRLPTTVLGLLVHLAEHTQRHLGQMITLCKLASPASP